MSDHESDQLLLIAMIDVFERAGLSVRFESLGVDDVKGRGGKCRLRNREMIILDRNLATAEKIEILAVELAGMEDTLEGVFLPPNVREAIERVPGAKK